MAGEVAGLEVEIAPRQGETVETPPQGVVDDKTPGALSYAKAPTSLLSWVTMGRMYAVFAVLWVLAGVLVPYFIVGIADPATQWQALSSLPDLGGTPGKAFCMGIHFVTGSIITLLGVFQVWPGSRTTDRVFWHRVGGRVFVVCSVITFLGGFGFIVQQRILAGGWSMTISFAIYGFLVLGFTLMAYISIKQKDIEAHRRWALRSFAMGAGSFFYRAMMAIGPVFGFLPWVTTPEMVEPREDRTTWHLSEPIWSQASSWSFWVVSVLWVEWYLRAPSTKMTRALLDVSLVLFMAMLGAFGLVFLVELSFALY